MNSFSSRYFLASVSSPQSKIAADEHLGFIFPSLFFFSASSLKMFHYVPQMFVDAHSCKKMLKDVYNIFKRACFAYKYYSIIRIRKRMRSKAVFKTRYANSKVQEIKCLSVGRAFKRGREASLNPW